jgi:hypothetical protein
MAAFDTASIGAARGLTGGFGAAANDIFSGFASQEMAKGSVISGEMYRYAAGIARQNEVLEGYATKIKQTQEERQAFKMTGQQIADVAGAGFAESGSAIDLLRSSNQQGALAKQLIGEQGNIQQNTYEEQATAYDAMAASAEAKAKAESKSAQGKFVSAGFNVAAGVVSGLFTSGIGTATAGADLLAAMPTDL